MSASESLQSMEKSAYRRAYSDGVIDVFAGISLLLMGAIWIWLPDYGGLAGILPAVFMPVVISARKRFIERRLGYVRWSEPRRGKERRNLILLLSGGFLLLVMGVIAFFVVEGSLVDESVLDLIMPGLLAWLLALVAIGLAILLESWRLVLYAVALAAGGLVTGLLGANPGWPLLAAGVVIAITGLIMLSKFVKANPASVDV